MMFKRGSAGSARTWHNNLVFIVALIPPILWATSIVAAKVVVSSFPPFTAATVRFVMASVIMWELWAALPDQRQWPERSDWAWLVITGFFQTSLYFALQYAGVELTSASNASIIVNVRPIFVAVLALFLLGEKLTRKTILAIAMGFVGVLIVTSNGSLENLSLSTTHFLGDMLIVLNALSGAVGLVLTKRVLRQFRPLPALVFTLTFGAVGLLPFAGFEIWQRGGMPSTSWLPWLLLVYQAIFCSVVAHFLWNNVLVRLDASKSAVFLYVSPIVGVILANLLLGEAVTVYLALGAVFVLVGAYQATWPDRVRVPATAKG
jgi:drug/metabolite transporter (DMT)-like permease